MTHPPRPNGLRPGDFVADRYRLGPLLGKGGMADVWEATDERLHRTVALKVLRDDAAAPEGAAQARQRFEEEGRLAAHQIHRNIVTVLDAGRDDDVAYLVLEHLDGETLRDRLSDGPLGDDEASAVMADVLAALDAAHHHGIVHRDIKPGNVLRGRDGQWKVADFGIAKMVDADLASDLTLTGQVIGTPRYMAPERLAGHPATVSSDIYAAGVLLHEALGDRTDAGPLLRAAAERAMSVDPAKRFRSAGSMREAFTTRGNAPTAVIPIAVPSTHAAATATAQVAADAPTIATDGPPTRHLPSGPGPRRGRALAAALAALLVLGALGAVAWLGQGEPGTGDGPATATPTTTLPLTSSTSTSSTSTTTTVTTTTTPVTTVAPTEPSPKTDPKAKPKEKGKGGPKDKGP